MLGGRVILFIFFQKFELSRLNSVFFKILSRLNSKFFPTGRNCPNILFCLFGHFWVEPVQLGFWTFGFSREPGALFFLTTNSITILAYCEWRAAAPGLKPLRLPRAQTTPPPNVGCFGPFWRGGQNLGPKFCLQQSCSAVDLNKAVLPWRRKCWRKRYSNTMRMQNHAKLAAGAHQGHMAKPEQVPALVCDTCARRILCAAAIWGLFCSYGAK